MISFWLYIFKFLSGQRIIKLGEMARVTVT